MTTAGDWQDLHRASEVPRYEAIAKLINERVFAAPTTVLDVGCGEGVLFGHLRKGVEYTGLEMSRDASFWAVENWIPVINANAEEFPLNGRKWDFVVLSEVLYYCSDPEAVLEKYRDAVAPGGMLIVTIFQKPEPAQTKLARLCGFGGVTNKSCTKLVDLFSYGQKVHRETIKRLGGGEWVLWGVR